MCAGLDFGIITATTSTPYTRPWWSGSASAQLHRRRMDAIRAANAGHSLRARRALDPFSELPGAGADYVSAPAAPLRATLDRLDECYVEDCARALMKVLMDLRMWRDPCSAAWTTGLPLFKAGGGARHRLITRALREGEPTSHQSRYCEGG